MPLDEINVMNRLALNSEENTDFKKKPVSNRVKFGLLFAINVISQFWEEDFGFSYFREKFRECLVILFAFGIYRLSFFFVKGLCYIRDGRRR